MNLLLELRHLLRKTTCLAFGHRGVQRDGAYYCDRCDTPQPQPRRW
jgi:hypothetical protein